MSNLSHIDLRTAEDGKYLVIANGKYYYIGELLFDILRGVKANRSVQDIQADLAREKQVELPLNQLQETIDRTLERFGPAEEDYRGNIGRFSYIYLKLKMLGEGPLNRLVAPLVSLFRPRTMRLLSAVAILLTLLYYAVASRPSLAGISVGQVLLVYGLLFLIFFLHEVGHATASKYFGVNPGEISFGFYLVFPVFFADVSKIWSLNKRKRIVVNLGGVYFQLLINGLLIPIALLLPDSNRLLSTIIHTNVFVIFYSLVPFLRYDGYWIYSDWFEIPNLMRRSIRYPFRVLKDYRAGRGVNLPLLLYSLLNYVVFTSVFYFIGRFFTFSAVYLAAEIEQTTDPMELLTRQNMAGLFRLCTMLFLVGFLLRRLLKSGRRFINQI
jgi:putative peptide zinc metalloprotease protein